MVSKISKYYCKDGWQTKVYKPKTYNINYKDPGWISLRAFMSIKQKGKCGMCKKELPIKEFTLHHILPRTKGGQNNIDNLIGLCNKCHDIAEIEELNRNDIINYYNKGVKKERAIKNDWHMWVYGGYSRPGIKKINYVKKINIADDIIDKAEYEFPKKISLREKYTIKRAKSKYTSKYGYTLKEMAILCRVSHSTLFNWIKDPIKERKVIKLLENIA